MKPGKILFAQKLYSIPNFDGLEQPISFPFMPFILQ